MALLNLIVHLVCQQEALSLCLSFHLKFETQPVGGDEGRVTQMRSAAVTMWPVTMCTVHSKTRCCRWKSTCSYTSVERSSSPRFSQGAAPSEPVPTWKWHHRSDRQETHQGQITPVKTLKVQGLNALLMTPGAKVLLYFNGHRQWSVSVKWLHVDRHLTAIIYTLYWSVFNQSHRTDSGAWLWHKPRRHLLERSLL